MKYVKQKLFRYLGRYFIVIATGALFFFFGSFLCLILINPAANELRMSSREASTPTANGKISTFLTVLIITGPNYYESRDTIRDTWLQLAAKLDICWFFVIGTKSLDDAAKALLHSEQSEKQDLLLLPNIEDSYLSLPMKLLHSLAWVEKNVATKFVLKVDDDSFVRLDALVKELQEKYVNDTRLYWGFFDGRATPKRRGKWNEDNWFMCDRYLPYALGGGYVIGADLAYFVGKNVQYLQCYNSEDVSLGAWLAPVMATRVHDPRFDTEYKSRGCFNAYVITHKQSSAEMREKYHELKTKNRLCSKQYRTRYSYVYNWNVAPSQCCYRNNTKVP